MSKIESRIGVVKYSDEKIFSFISDFSNFNNLMPSYKLAEWQADKDTCSFNIAGIGKAGLKIIEREPHKLIKISADDNTPMRLTMWVQLKMAGENDTRVKITVEPDVNAVTMMMVQKPLKEFIDKMISKLEEFRF